MPRAKNSGNIKVAKTSAGETNLDMSPIMLDLDRSTVTKLINTMEALEIELQYLLARSHFEGRVIREIDSAEED